MKHAPATVDWKALSGARIFFGHQSVGENILEGIQDLLKENPGAALQILKSPDPASLSGPAFLHTSIGKNEDPKSKCDDFARIMESGVAEKVDIACFKFCFVDVTADTDVEDLFAYYEKTLATLKTKYPKTTFVHVTVPLTTVPSGPRVWLKSVLGILKGWHADNAARNRYNEILLRHYEGREPVFDLARAESTLPDGARCSYHYKGDVYSCLVSAYTCDGGHLNPLGRRVVAQQFLAFLGELAARTPRN